MGVPASDHILAEAHYPPDRSQPVFERSIGDALRGAAAKWPCLNRTAPIISSFLS